jgi:hypothetical protein
MFAASKAGRAGGATTDPNFNNVSLLLETTSTNGQQNNTFLDSSTNNYTLTRSGTPTQGSVTPYWPDGYWSNYFNGSTDYLSVPSNAGFAFGTGDFTVECWIYLNAVPTNNPPILFAGNFYFNFRSSGTLAITNATVEYARSGVALTAGSWFHVAAVRSSAGMYVYVNGTRGTLNTGTPTFTQGIAYIASDTTQYINGYISNHRVVKGVAVYTANFTPPTTPLTAITNTTLLTCQSNRFKDNSANNFAITLLGTPRTQPFQPFSPAASYTTAAYGGSIYSGTKTDNLTAPATSGLTTFTGNFTIECWVYPTDITLSTSWAILDARNIGASNAQWVMSLNGYISSPSGWVVDFFLGNPNDALFGLRVPPNTWSHIVVQRNSGTIRSFVNGVVDTITYSGGVFAGTITGTATANPITINNSKDSGLGNYGNVGYTSNLRIVNGTAVYATTGFTPPTAPVTAITNTSLLLNYTNAGIYDAAVQNNAITVGDAQSSTTQYKWSPTSMKYDGTGDWLTAIDGPQLQLGTGDFTIDGWFYLAANGVAYGIVSKGTASTGWSVNVTSGNRLQFSYTASNLTGATTTLAATTWYYFAVVRSGSATGNLKIYINGAVEATSGGAVTDNFNQTDILYVGASRTGTTPLNGYLQDVRITKYARTITTPTAAFPTR